MEYFDLISKLVPTLGGTGMMAAVVVLWKIGFFEKKDPEEYFERARQSGKKESSDLVEDMKKRIDEYQKAQNVQMEFYHKEHIVRLDKIDNHLATLNARISKHDVEIAVLKEKHDK